MPMLPSAAQQFRLKVTFSLATWNVLPRAMRYFALGGLSRGIKDTPFRVAILSTSETPSVSASVAPSCIALRLAKARHSHRVDAEQCHYRGPFRGLRLVPMPTLPSAAQ
jgi:hypothetical protein